MKKHRRRSTELWVLSFLVATHCLEVEAFLSTFKPRPQMNCERSCSSGLSKCTKPVLPSRPTPVVRTVASDSSQISRRREAMAEITKIAVSLIASWIWTTRAASAATSRVSTLPEPLGVRQLLLAMGLISSVGGFAMTRMGLGSLAKDILAASLRCTVQLFLLGSIILQNLFGTTRPLVVWAWIVGVGTLGALEAFSRVEYTYPRLRRHVLFSVLISGLSVLGIALLGGVFGKLTPWFRPRTLVTIAGMLFGNTLSAATLGASTLTREFSQTRSQIELRLARGASSEEAMIPITKNAVVSALTPTINSLAVTGLIHIPGMMSGQVLAGQSPIQAAAYQVLISILIATTACATVQLLSILVTQELMDRKGHRLRTQELVQKASRKSKRRLFSAFLSSRSQTKDDFPDGLHINGSDKRLDPGNIAGRHATARVLGNQENEPALILTADKVHVARADLNVTFNLGRGDRIGITGNSGAGKTQVLRTLIGLEPLKGIIDLDGVSPEQMKWPEWRRQVCWVSQDRPTLEGTPRDFLAEINRYHSQEAVSRSDPASIARDWRLPEAVFDQPWATLSGGEAQRVSLALALSLKPRVLLLDEATSALDHETSLIVEDALKASKIPIILVTHSADQLDRLCTHHVDLSTEELTLDTV